MNLVNLFDIKEENILPGYWVKFVHSANMTFAHWRIEAGAPLPNHSHPHEQVTTILDGDFEITIDGETKVLSPGMVVIIPGDTKHSGRAVSECRILDTFYPAREDYRNRSKI